MKKQKKKKKKRTENVMGRLARGLWLEEEGIGICVEGRTYFVS